MKIDYINKYLENHINNWYRNSLLDYGINGRFVRVNVYGDKGQHLSIIWEEDGRQYKMPVSWWAEYTAEQIYNIWMEFGGDEDTEEITVA